MGGGGGGGAGAAPRRDSLPGSGAYGYALPDEDEFSKEPPLLPPHLRNIVLNSPPPSLTDPDPLTLLTPQHVTLTHLYCTAIVNGVMVQAISQRYRRKATTTLYYCVVR
jgi:5'-AMP-activated protein kinase regulatory beta subunit